jgi:hypothetical protein
MFETALGQKLGNQVASLDEKPRDEKSHDLISSTKMILV